MEESYIAKSTIQEIRERFDQDVERFSNIETGQSATMDAALAMQLITQAAVASCSPINRVLDIGCGAGNNTIKLREALGHNFTSVLLDLSHPMLAKAKERVAQVNSGNVETIAGDFREAALEPESFDVILAAAVLHHLRDDNDWRKAFAKIHHLLRPGGSVWITDLVIHETSAIHQMMWTRYGNYLVEQKNEEYRDSVFAYIEQEDSPRPVTYQLDLLKSVGFAHVELLHKNSCFAAFGAIKA